MGHGRRKGALKCAQNDASRRPTDVQGEYEKFASGIVKSGRSMQLGIWNLGRGAAYEWAPAMSVNMTAATQKTPGAFRGAWVSDFPCNIRRRGW